MVSLNDTNVFVQPFRIRRVAGSTLQAEATVMDTAQLEKGGSVQVKTTIRSDGSPLENVRGEYQLLSAGRELKYGRLTTNVFGEAFINFTYPDLPDDQSLRLKMLFTRENDQAELSLNLPHRGNPLTINCHPEGGRLVSGGRVSLEVLDIHGHPVSTGILIKHGTETVDSVHTGRQGTVVWEVPSAPGVRYTLATVNGKGKQELVVPPLNQPAGYSLKLYNDSTGCRAVVRNNGSSSYALLVLRSLDEVMWSQPVSVAQSDSTVVDVPIGTLPKGIWNLALFDGENQLCAERLFMNKQTDDYQVIIQTEQQGYGTKKKVTVRLQVTDAAGNPVVANLSVSATEKNRMDSILFRDIRYSQHYSALAPDFRHRLSSAHAAGLDGLLFSHQWTHSQWSSVLSDNNTGMTARIPIKHGTTGLVVGTNVRIKSVVLRGINDIAIKGGKLEPLVQRRTLEIDRKTHTFFVPDSLLFSGKGKEWQLEIPRIRYAPHRALYLVEWRDPHILFDSTIVRGQQLHRPEALNIFTGSRSQEVSSFDFHSVNRMKEVVVGKKEKPVRRRLRMSNCEWYEAMMVRDISTIWIPKKGGWHIPKGTPFPFGWHFDGNTKVLCLNHKNKKHKLKNR